MPGTSKFMRWLDQNVGWEVERPGGECSFYNYFVGGSLAIYRKGGALICTP